MSIISALYIIIEETSSISAKSFPFKMNIANATEKCEYDPLDPSNGQKDTLVQLVLSLGLGISAFVGFCILRPRWKGLYAARKRQIDSAAELPDLPDSFFGWMPVLYKITEEQVLASAGLDAYVFLSFFRMSIKLFSIIFLAAAAIILPINRHYQPYQPSKASQSFFYPQQMFAAEELNWDWDERANIFSKPIPGDQKDTNYLWAYLAFTYIFTGLSLYIMLLETRKIIRVRQNYLGSQSTITDRTFRLSGIPRQLRSEEEIQRFLEKLEIGKVESVTICRDWAELDDLMDKRAATLRKLEEAWTVHLGQPARLSKQIDQPSEISNGSGENEQDGLLGDHVTSYDQPRPSTRIWFGFWKLQSKTVDAIDFYETKLNSLDQEILAARKKKYMPTPQAFVTMDSVAACQMAVQALLDPSPLSLSTSLAPAPSDIVWRNTYQSRSTRMVRSWVITAFIIFLSIVWIFAVGPLAGLVNLCSIQKLMPQFAEFLDRHQILRSLVQTGLPTLVVSLLNVAVPYLYEYMSNHQGMVSQADVELSVISKNFFFTFFNVFVIFTVFGTTANFYATLKKSLQDTTAIAYQLASSLTQLSVFYLNFIMLQAIGLFPFRLLEFGSVFCYPIMLIGSKTPRDYAELVQPPLFKYGFYLPTAILVWILCIVYSVLLNGYQVVFFGLVYFVLGFFTYKYQLLYAMDHPQHSTGGAWPLICYRLMVGLGVFQLAMAGVIALSHNAFKRAAAVVPLILFTIWFFYFYKRTFEPLTKFIALRSIRRQSHSNFNLADEDFGPPARPDPRRMTSTTVDEEREKGQKFVNPSLIVPLEKVWITKSQTQSRNGSTGQIGESQGPDSTSSSVSLGDTHVWRENGDNNV